MMINRRQLGLLIFGSMSILFLSSNILAQLSSSDNQNTQSESSESSFSVIGYYAVFGVRLAPPQLMDYSALTHIIHFNVNPSQTSPFFNPVLSVAESLDIEFSYTYAGNLNTPVQRILIDSSHAHGGKVLLGIAATIYNSAAYAAMDNITQDSARCQTFVDSYISYLQRKGYDGVDVNWEFPSSTQKSNYMRMMRLFRRSLNNLGTYRGKALGNNGRGILTQTSYAYNRPLSANQWFVASELDTLINFIMPEMYTLGVGQMNSYQGYGCGLYKSNCTTYDAHILAESTYQGGYAGPIGLANMGLNRSRIAPGLGFEKYLYRNVTGVCQTPGTAADGGNFHYMMVENPTVGYGLKPEFWDDAAKVHYKTWNDAGTNYFLTYEDSASLAIKVAWIKQQGFGGVMLYSLNEGYISAVNAYGGMPNYPGDRQKLLHSVAKAAWGTSPPPPPNQPKIKGQIFFDKNNNGLKDAGDVGLPGWTVRLSGTKSDSTESDKDGNYLFDALSFGTYSVAQVLRSGWTKTYPTSASSYAVTLDSAHQNFTADFGDFAFNAFGIPVSMDWNIVSLPVKVSDPRTTTVFPSAISAASAYFNRYVLVDSLVNGLGYWLRFGEQQTAWVVGGANTSDTVDIVEGWNIVGSLSIPLPISNIQSSPPNNIISGYYGYDHGFSFADELIPGKGYWVQATTSGSLILGSSPENPSQANGKLKDKLRELSSITFTSGRGESQTLYVDCNGTNVPLDHRYELPPLPPRGVFDIRFSPVNEHSLGTFVRQVPLSGNKFVDVPINLQDASFPMVVQWSSNDSRIGSVSIFFDNNRYDLQDEKDVSLAEAATTRQITMRISPPTVQKIPSSFLLYQNYPNPFNPSTNIQFSIPEESYVQINVFNILGRQVVSLLNQRMPAGAHDIQFDGTQFSSGVYYYRVVVQMASGETSIKAGKMLLMK